MVMKPIFALTLYMSIPHLNAAWTARIADPQAKLVLVRLADMAKKETGLCWPPLDDLIADTELHKSTICRKLDLLEKLGWITRTRKKIGSEIIVHLEPQEVAHCDFSTPSRSRTVRPEKSHTATSEKTPEVAHCDSEVAHCDFSILENPKKPKIYRESPEKKESGKEPIPVPETFPEKSPYPTLAQAIEYGKTIRMSEQAATFWWEVRDSAGWTKSQSGGGVARKITGWQSDMSVSIPWAEKGAHERKIALNSSPSTGTVVIGGRTFRS